MKLKLIISSFFLLFLVQNSNAQDDLLRELDVNSSGREVTPYAFKALQICNIQSTKLPAKGEFYLLITHRFADLTNGINNFFGLDNANTKVGGIYGVADWLSIGLSRHTLQKTYETALKLRVANQIDGGFPVTIAGYGTVDVNTALDKADYPSLKFQNRLAYSAQLLVSRKISDALSVEVAPIYTHKNVFDNTTEFADLFLVGYGARYKLTKRLSVNLEYDARLKLKDGFLDNKFKNPVTLGLDIETGGHVFQLVLSNSQAINDVSIFSNSTGTFKQGIYFGFNMYRVF